MARGQRDVYTRIITAVQERDILYNPFHPRYRNKKTVDYVWAEVADIAGLSVPETKRTWSTLRSSYNRSLSKERLSGGSKWYLADQMEFLRPFLDKDGGAGHDSECNDTEVDLLLDTPDIKTEQGSPGRPAVSADESSSPSPESFGLSGTADSLTSPNTTPRSVQPKAESSVDSLKRPLTVDERPNTGHGLSQTKKAKPFSMADNFSTANSQSTGGPESSRLHGVIGEDSRLQYVSPARSGGYPGSTLDADADWAFFQGLLPMIQTLQGRNKRRVQRQILEVVHAAVDKEEEEQERQRETDIGERGIQT